LRRGQTTLEYVFIIGIVAAAIIAASVYIKRGFQGSIRSASDDLSASQYSPGNTQTDNRIEKNFSSTITSTSTATTVYGNMQIQSPGMARNKEEQDRLLAELKRLEEYRSSIAISESAITSAAVSASGTGLNSDLRLQQAVAQSRQEGLAPFNEEIAKRERRLAELEEEYRNLDSQWRERGCNTYWWGWRRGCHNIYRQMQRNQKQQGDLRRELNVLRGIRPTAEAEAQSAAENASTQGVRTQSGDLPENLLGLTLAEIDQLISQTRKELDELRETYKKLAKTWEERTIRPDRTGVRSSNIEEGSVRSSTRIDESLGRYSNER